MKFDVSSANLLKQLQIVGGAIGSNPVLPILEDFLFSISGNTLTITATDLETSITTSMEVVADGEGRIAVPAKILLETLKALPEQPITFSFDEENFGIQITSSYGKYKLAGENGQDFPTIPEQDDSADTVSIGADTLVHAINKTLFATSHDELRPAMTGVLFQVDFSKLTFVATDAHKLVKFVYEKLESNLNTSFIVPKKPLQLIKGNLQAGDDVSIAFTNSNAFFSFGTIQVVSRLIDARYPDYNAVIPTENPNLLTVTRQDFLNSLRRIAIYANKTTNQVQLNISDGSLTVSAQDLDFSNEASEQLPCSYEGEPIRIGFNAKFLIEMLSVLESDEVQMELSTPSRAGILLPVEEEKEGEDILMLVMPVMLSN
jgi:DNA polymerase-3 subunit beta